MAEDIIFKPLQFRSLTVKNRIFRSNMTGPFDHYDGTGTDVRINWEEQFARGGVGAICSAHCPVSVVGRISPYVAMLDHDDKIPFWTALIERVHQYDCKYIIQLSHAGRQRDEPGIENQSQPGMSSTSQPDYIHGLPSRAMTKDEIRLVQRQFREAAQRALKAGADGIELHAANGYLFTQFLSSAVNDRTDEYGGELKNRARFLLEVIQEIREGIGPHPHLQVKLSVVDYANILLPLRRPGNSLEESVQVCQWAEQAGADAIVVSTGSFAPHPKNPAGDFPLNTARLTYQMMINSGSLTYRNYVLMRVWPFGQIFRWWWTLRRGPKSSIQGILADKAAAVKANVKVPVLVTGGFQSASAIRSVIESGKADGVTIARPLIANPDLVRFFADGKDVPDRPCTYCNCCLVEALENPLGCYEPARYNGDTKAMIAKVLSIYRPQEFAPLPGHNVPGNNGVPLTKPDEAR
jgi:2,4-dienoyl-CoA reductase-like NADH-dependent reductase (Old Yellow Enzyme family)